MNGIDDDAVQTGFLLQFDKLVEQGGLIVLLGRNDGLPAHPFHSESESARPVALPSGVRQSLRA